MNNKLLTYASLLVILVFIGYMVYDSVRPEKLEVTESGSLSEETFPKDMWEVTHEIVINEGRLNAVAASDNNKIFAAGNSFVSCYKIAGSERLWTFKTDEPVTSVAVWGDSIYATTVDRVLIISGEGKLISEWGPYEGRSIFTSISAGRARVAVCDAGNKKVFILDKGGEVISMAGVNALEFIIPSAYFDVTINDDNSFWVANTGHRRIERRNEAGEIESYFGEAGLAPEAFCGCCNPAHFGVIPGGFITAEKGVNRIKILDHKGQFVEFVSSRNEFTPSVPLYVASADGTIIVAANQEDSKVYVFERK